MWGMGSGKTIGGIITMMLLDNRQKALVICDKSVKEQWANEVRRMLGCNYDDFNDITIQVAHYEQLDDVASKAPRESEIVLVDEAHRFRNAVDNESERMMRWIECIQQCERVVYLSGTPVVNNAEREMRSFHYMMGTSNLNHRISAYDPREDKNQAHNYAKVNYITVRCPMSWAQCLLYLMSRRQKFTIHLEGEQTPRTRVTSLQNSYNVALRTLSNYPFDGKPELSPKMCRITDELLAREADRRRQLVYSSRRDSGVFALIKLYKSRCTHPTSIYQVNGSMTATERAKQVKCYNRCANGGVLFITDAGAQGIDCKGVTVVHIVEPSQVMQEERQVVNRAVRFKAHRRVTDSAVSVLQYVTMFPESGSVSYPWKRVLYDTGMFAKDEMVGITRPVQYALKRVIEEEERNETIDERTMRTRMSSYEDVCETLRHIAGFSI